MLYPSGCNAAPQSVPFKSAMTYQDPIRRGMLKTIGGWVLRTALKIMQLYREFNQVLVIKWEKFDLIAELTSSPTY